MINIMADSDHEEEGDLNIARRTRSHLRIDDFVPNDNLDFPDVDMNLYQNPDSEGDPEYKKFLNQCYSEEIGTDTNTDDNDPEYVYNDDIFSHGWRFDLNEVKDLVQEDYSNTSPHAINLEIGDNDPSGLTDAKDDPLAFKSPSKLLRRKIDMFNDPEFARILNQQLRQHIQLLTQTYLLTRNTSNMQNEADEAKSHLSSYMKIFKNKTKPSNLLPALELVNNLDSPKDLKSSIRLSWRPLPIPDSVKKIIHSNPNVFIYPSLLPQVAFSFLPEKLIPKKPKINFTINEDKLLAYALNEFRGETSQYAFIASLLMTAKTKTQISNHIKNIKRSPGNENNPIKLYYANGLLPEIDLDSDSEQLMIHDQIEDCKPIENKQESMMDSVVADIDEDAEFKQQQEQFLLPNCEHSTRSISEGQDELMNMNLDDLIAASTTISKSSMMNNNSDNNNNNKNIKNLKLKKSMLNLMSHNFLLSEEMGDLIIHEFLKTANQKLNERNHLQLLQLLTDLMKESNGEDDKRIVKIYREISLFLERINAPAELHERIVLFLNLEQATKCGCALTYLHWMRFFEFMQHLELYHDGVEALEKKLVRLLDALQKEDPHKVKLAVGNLVNKHPFLKREFESLSLEEKPHPSLFICEEDFDDITEAINTFNKGGSDEKSNFYEFEHFNAKPTKEELCYASQSCPCKCHTEATTNDGQLSQHCNQCNLKFMKGRMYLVNKIKPILAEWSYTGRLKPVVKSANTGSEKSPDWTIQEDRDILEFCRLKAEQNDETATFDASTFEELVMKRQAEHGNSVSKKSAQEIAYRFNQLMDMYTEENMSTT